MYTLEQLAEQTGGWVIGDPETEITGVQPFEEAGPGDITVALSRRFLEALPSTEASAVIVPDSTVSKAKMLLVVENPKLAFAQILHLFTSKPFRATGISPLASIGEDCRIADAVSIHPFASVGSNVVIDERVTLWPGVVVGDDCRIGERSTLHPNVTIYPKVSVGKDVILHSGTVIGADGFGYVFDGKRQVKLPQTGSVEIRDEVEIGANSCVDRATFGTTIIERGVKLDNHVHIAHNCRIGENTVIVGCVGISGSVQIGRNCILAGQCGTVDHVKIGDNVKVMARAVVTKDVPSGSTISGSHGRDHRQQLKIEALVRRLPHIYKKWLAMKEP
jgi:UDP-3-O-[3-hydroxymyristoyl] glucosamine N-acyltransferase